MHAMTVAHRHNEGGAPEVRAATPRNAPRAEHRLSHLSSLYEERTPPGRGSVRERRHLDRCRLGSEIRRRKLLLSDKRSLYPAGLSGCDPDLVGRVLADVREEEAADAIPARTLSGSGSGAAPPAVLAGAGDSPFTNLVSAPVISDSSDDGGGTSSAVSTQVPRAVAKPSHQPTAQLPQLEISVLAYETRRNTKLRREPKCESRYQPRQSESPVNSSGSL